MQGKSDGMVRHLRAHRLVLDTAHPNVNLKYIDVIELEGPGGEPEVWTRSLRVPGQEENGSRLIWRRRKFQTYEEARDRQIDFERDLGVLVKEQQIIDPDHPNMGPGPSAEDRRREGR